MINPFDRCNKKSFLSVGVTVPLFRYVNVGILYEEFNGWTYAYSSGVNGGFGFGSSRVQLKRLGLLIEYNFEIVDNRINISPIFNLSKEVNLLQQSEGRQIVNIFDGSTNRNEYVGYTEVEVYKGGQFIPAVGFSLKVRIWKGFSVFGTLKWSIGNKVFQEMFVNYSYLGEPQPIAHFSNKGSGFIQVFGLSYNLNLLNPFFSE